MISAAGLFINIQFVNNFTSPKILFDDWKELKQKPYKNETQKHFMERNILKIV